MFSEETIVSEEQNRYRQQFIPSITYNQVAVKCVTLRDEPLKNQWLKGVGKMQKHTCKLNKKILLKDIVLAQARTDVKQIIL